MTIKDKIGNVVEYGDVVEFGKFRGIVYKICHDSVWVQSDIGNIRVKDFVKALDQRR